MFYLKNTKLILIFALLMVVVACSNGQDASSTKNSAVQNTERQGGESEQIEIRFGHPDAETNHQDSPYFAYTDTFQAILDEKTNGRITLKVFPNSMLGDIRSMMEQTAGGNLEMTAGQNSGLLASYYPNIQALDIPYVFENLDIGRKVLEGEFGQRITEDIADVANLRIVSFLPSAFRSFANNDAPISTPEDLKGKKIRVMEIPIHQEMVRALDANPVVTTFEELYTAIQTGVLDVHENSPYTMLMANLQEVTKYYSLDKHLLNTAVVMINENFFKGLSAEDQAIILSAAEEAKNVFLDIVIGKTESDIQTLRDAGVEVNELSSEQFQAFQDKVTGPVLKKLESELDKAFIDSMFEAIEAAK